MPIHVFVDENKSRGLLMAAARCPSGEVAVHRKALRGLLLPGQERLHFNHETDARRKQIIQVIADFHLLVDVYQADRDTWADRRRCLEAVVRDTAGMAERLVVEREESTYDHDQRTLHAACQRFKCFDLRWELMVPKLDPLLWVPDAIAWTWRRGGSWRRSVERFCQVRAL
ncbi:hypothetical protein EV643_12151 [Kribbella sp. VKM Ac-2527]|uniref:DUF3800 family protein n=1 Tax=Kribbella caucasensis TaxID=2512215 RepID=A0A4R6JIC3_9ACTN|nr:hypothetical protein [Kribbella sp. VKM Ac-2527]TDO35779.1 hypothetical protein EV643_12151 [Kribbella sp. VKM Ac-2527]